MENDINGLEKEVNKLQQKLLKFLDEKIDIERNIKVEMITIKDNEMVNIDVYTEMYSDEEELKYELWDIRENIAMLDNTLIKPISKSKRRSIRKSISKKSVFYDFEFPKKYINFAEKNKDYYSRKSAEYSDLIDEFNKIIYAEENCFSSNWNEKNEVTYLSDMQRLYDDLSHQMNIILNSKKIN